MKNIDTKTAAFDAETDDQYFHMHVQLEDKHLVHQYYDPTEDMERLIDGDIIPEEPEQDPNEAKRKVEELLNKLTDRQRQLVKMYYLENKTMKQIADELGLSFSTVQKNLKGNYEKKYDRKFGGAINALRKGIFECSNNKCHEKVYKDGLCDLHYNNVCTVDNCFGKLYAKCYCKTHYLREKKRLPIVKPVKICSVEGCNIKMKAKGLCSSHYFKSRREKNKGESNG